MLFIEKLPTRYDAGLASVEAGQKTVTPTDAAWLGNAWGDDLFFLPSQPLVPPQRIEAVNEDGTLTLAVEWPGTTDTEVAYEIRYVGIIERSTAQTRKVLEELGEVKAYYDVQVDTLGDRAAFDSYPAGYRVLVSDIGDGRAAIYSKASSTDGNWTDAAMFSGPISTVAVGDVDSVPFGNGPNVTSTPVAGGVLLNFELEEAPTLTFPPVLTVAADQNADAIVTPVAGGYSVQLSIPRGPAGDIEGVTPFWQGRITNDADAAAARAGLEAVSGPASAVDGRIAVFDGTTGKLLKDSGLKPEDIGSVDALFEGDLGKTPIEQAQARSNTSAASLADTRRNRIVNGDMRVSQENGATSGTSNGRYPVDQWAQYFITSAGVLTVAQVASVTPAGSSNRLRATVTTADATLAAGEYWTLTQLLEGSNVADFQYGGASTKNAVLRFGFKGPAGTYAVHLGNSASNRSFVALFTISAGEANTDTVQEIAIPGDVTGTWLTADGVIGITLDIVLACGSTFQGSTGWQSGNILGTSAVSNGMATQGAVFELFDVGLKLDPSATGVYGQYEVGEVDAVYRSERYAEKFLANGGFLIIGLFYNSGNYWSWLDIFEKCKTPTSSNTWAGTAPGAPLHTRKRLLFNSVGFFTSTSDILVLARLS